MKKLFILAVLLVCFVLGVTAHPAKKVNLTYENGKLKIEAIHKVKNVKAHFIEQIVVNVDGKIVKTIDLKSQTSGSAEILELLILEIKKGSKVSVTTRCNILGSKTGKLTI